MAGASDRSPAASSRPRRSILDSRPPALALLALLVLPWSVQLFADAAPAVRFVWGMVTADPWAVSFLPAYLRFGRAPLVFAWLLAAGLYALAVGAVLVAALSDRGDPRLVAGLLALAGVANAVVDWRFAVQPGRVAYPVGSLALWVVAWWTARGD